MKDRVQYAFHKTVPVMAGYVFLGIAFGISLSEAGYGYQWALLMSALVYAGSMQFAMIPMLAGGVSMLTMAVTTLFVNGRHLFYGISFVESFRRLRGRPYMIFSLTDETYSVLCGCRSEDPEETRRDCWLLISGLDHLYWIAGSVLGGILGEALTIDFTGIDFSMTALFVVILIEQILSDRTRNLRVGIVGLLVATVSLLILSAEHFLLPALIVTVGIVALYAGVREGGKEDSDA